MQISPPWRSLGLIAPLVILVLLSFVWPVVTLLGKSTEGAGGGEIFPTASAMLASWKADSPARLPAEDIQRTLARELADAHQTEAFASYLRRLSMQAPSYRGLLLKTARQLNEAKTSGGLVALREIDPRWEDLDTWRVIERSTHVHTAAHLAAAVDREISPAGYWQPVSSDQAIYLDALTRTVAITVAVTAIAIMLGYPLAFALVSSSPRVGALLLFAVMIPFWTSLLVRTTGWIVLLQEQGLINKLLLDIGLLDAPLKLMYNRFGVMVAMVHVLLPFMVLPVYSTMRGLSIAHTRAAASLGASPLNVFSRIYVPLTIPGVAAGTLLVFTQALGYFITPALVGGPSDQMLGSFVTLHANETLNWALAAALASMLLVSTLVLFFLYARFAELERLGAQ